MRARSSYSVIETVFTALGKAGADIALAGLVLARLEAWQTMRVADRQRLEDLLAALGQ